MNGAPPAEPVAEPPVVVLGVAEPPVVVLGVAVLGVAVLGVAVLGVAWVAVAGFAKIVGDPADTELPVPSVTMPLRVTPPGVAAVCANAGQAAAIATSTA